MELRVWVDGAQRTITGVMLTTTCQDIVIALAHATKQAGRFTMIERWRNNERLLSPSEQPLVTLQRWGEHMNEVEFIMRKTSSDIPASQPTSQALNNQQQRQSLQAPLRNIQDGQLNRPTSSANNNRLSPNNVGSQANHHVLNDQTIDNMYQSHMYNLNRRPQTVLGPLTGSSGNLGLNYLHPHRHSMAGLANSFRPSLSTSTLPNFTNNLTAQPSNIPAMSRQSYTDDQMVSSNSSPLLRHIHNGYTHHKETNIQPTLPSQNQQEQSQASRNHPFEELYSTINKKRTNQPPAVPAKPRLMGPIAPVTSLHMTHPQMQPVGNPQMNYYHQTQSPVGMYPNNMRPRHPSGYMDYMEAMSNRNSLCQPLLLNSTYALGGQPAPNNMQSRPFDHQQVYNVHRNGSPLNATYAGEKYRYSSQSNPAEHEQANDGVRSTNGAHNTIRPNVLDPGIIIDRGPPDAKSTQASQNVSSPPSNDVRGQNSSRTESSSVSKMGHDMLKIIEEQKKVLLNQKNELDLLDNDREYKDTKETSEQAELMNRIESEIQQLEDLWKENQAQILKLENQDFERELEELKSERVRMETEIGKQKEKLSRCEDDIASCKVKIDQLESEISKLESESETSSSSDGEKDEIYMNLVKSTLSPRQDLNSSQETGAKTVQVGAHTNGVGQSGHLGDNLCKETKSSEEEDYEEDSGGDASDDINTLTPESKLRSAKDVAYVDKRGLISGIRSLKLDKSRVLARQLETIKSNESISSIAAAPSINPNDKTLSSNNVDDNRCHDKTGQYSNNKTASSNKYEFLMTL